MSELLRIARLAERCERTGESAEDAIGQEGVQDEDRRRLFQGATAGAAIAAAGVLAPGAWAAATQAVQTAVAKVTNTRGVAIVGAGIAGLACATELARLGVNARVFEAGTRVGGRMFSLRGFFPGQVAERGAEFIGTSHHVMLGYARQLKLQLEPFTRPGVEKFHFAGRAYSESQVVDEYRAFTAAIGDELARIQAPTADKHIEAATLLDLMSLSDFLDLYGAGDLLRAMMQAACEAEFGVEPGELSAIAFLRFVHGDRRTKFGAYNDGREDHLHVVGGNDLITSGLAAKLPQPVALGYRLVAVRKTAGGLVRLTFAVNGRYIDSDHDAVVLALPFSVLRKVDFHSSVEMPAFKRLAIDQSRTGDASKLMVGFKQPYWATSNNASGNVSANLPRLRNTWESNPTSGAATRAVLSHHVGGAAARVLRQETLQSDANAFLGDLERVLPGARNAARRDTKGNLQAAVQNWSLDPNALGAFPAPRPGYFTTIAHNEAKPIGNVYFAGDQTSSFYEWQGFMEGAALSGLRAASEAATLVLRR
jgi:monoamine oxidase